MRRFAIACILMALLVGANWWRSRPDGKAHVIVAPGPGDGILIRTAEGRSLLLDGGADGAATSSWLGHELPFWQRRLDLVILTRADSQTLPGQLAALRRYSPGAVAYVQPLGASASFTAWRAQATAGGATPRPLLAGTQLHLGSATITALEVADGRALLRIDLLQSSVYALESIGDEGADRLASTIDRPADLVLFPWRVRTTANLSARLQPRALIYTTGGRTDLQQSFAERWDGRVPSFHPALHGRIDWSTDGRLRSVAVERNP